MSRSKREYDVQEVEEIIQSKLNTLGGIKKKLTYNGVFQYNKKIANNYEYKRSNGELFTLYGYDFWAASYNGEDYYGKKRIDEIKNNSSVFVAGEEYSADEQDIITLVWDFHKKPDVLSKKLLKLFDRDRTRIKRYEKDNEELKNRVESLSKNLELFEKGLVSLFYNSSTAYNSLENVMAMNKSKDSIVYNDLKKMFNNDESRLCSLLNSDKNPPKPNSEDNIISIRSPEEERKRRRNKYDNKI